MVLQGGSCVLVVHVRAVKLRTDQRESKEINWMKRNQVLQADRSATHPYNDLLMETVMFLEEQSCKVL